MNHYPVSSSKMALLEQRMSAMGIRESDLEESFVRSGGPGGQNVNKVSTCVVLRHRPSGWIIKCQQDRSQAMNRYLARKLLVEKMDAQIRGTQSEEARRISKIRRQKRRRSKRAKDKLLADKAHHSRKKGMRGKVPADND